VVSARGKRIEAARKRVDARRAALGPYGDRPTARDRAIKRYSTTPISSDSFRDRRYPQQGGLRWDQKLGKKIKKGIDRGQIEFAGLGHGIGRLVAGMLGSWDEGQEARKDDKKWTYGGDPLDIGKGTMTDNWMKTQILPEYMDEYEKERDKGNLHWRELNEYTGGKSGIAERINTLNTLTPERLSKYNPIKQRNILESIVNPAEADAFRRSAAGKEGILNNAMLMDYINRAKELYGSAGLPSIAVDDEIMNYRDPIRDMVAPNVTPNYGDRDVLLDMNVPYKDEYVNQFDIAEGLSPIEKYLLQSKAQGRGGYEEDSEQAMIDAGFDMDYIGPTTRMAISKYPAAPTIYDSYFMTPEERETEAETRNLMKMGMPVFGEGGIRPFWDPSLSYEEAFENMTGGSLGYGG
jgi:hypothetical protein